jgi:MFS family permease
MILPVMCLCVVLIIATVAAINVSIPQIETSSLHPSNTQVVWIVDLYVIVFASLLFPAGAIGDRYGRKGALLAGLGPTSQADSRGAGHDATSCPRHHGRGGVRMPTTLAVISDLMAEVPRLPSGRHSRPSAAASALSSAAQSSRTSRGSTCFG